MEFATSVNSRVTRGHLDSGSGRSVPKSRASQKLRVPRLGRIPLILRGFCVANLCRKTSDFCDEFRDKETETPARILVSAEGSFKWPFMTRLLTLVGLPLDLPPSEKG